MYVCMYRSFQFLPCVCSAQSRLFDYHACCEGRADANTHTFTQTSSRTFTAQSLTGKAPLDGFSVTNVVKIIYFLNQKFKRVDNAAI